MGSVDTLEFFPYQPRRYQREVIEAVRSAVEEGKSFCLHAPTGFGKTPVILAALLPVIRDEGGSIIWAVRTGNETDRPVEELKEIAKRRRVFGLSFRGKRDMCLLARDLNVTGYEGVGTLCRMRRERCPYYRNLRKLDLEMPRRPLTFSEILRLSEDLKVCPYFLQIALLEFVDVVSLSYNYVLSPLGWVIRHKLPFRDSILVVDEAHNVERAAMELNSRSVTSTTVERALKEAERFDPRDDHGLQSKLLTLLDFMRRVAQAEEGTFDPEEFISLMDLSSDDVKALFWLAEEVYRDQMRRGKEPRSYANSVAEFLSLLLERVGVEGIAFLYERERNSVKLEVWDMRTGEVLSEIWGSFRSVIFMSGTLEPIGAFKDAVGIEECERMSIPSMADPERVHSVIVMGVSTRGEELSERMVRRYLKVVDAFLSLSGNLAIFTASYRVQDEVLQGIEELAEKYGRPLFVERKDMSGDEASTVLEEFKSLPKRGKEGLLVAPAGGRFAEGADFPGEELMGVMLLGIPFDRLTTKTRLLIEYNQRIHGPRRGRYIAYVVPALRRASQALGRVIRSEEDEGMFVLADERYTRPTYFRLLPDFIRWRVRTIRWDEVRPVEE